jgi:hypothetical protein
VLVSVAAPLSSGLVETAGVSVVGAAVADGAWTGAGVAGSATGPPMSSSTTGSFANDAGADLPIRPWPLAGGATCEWTSAITGTRRWMTRRVVVDFDVVR